ncbi:MAG: hypothetical protein OHK0046_27110 [Anaerolineae bacterium]
MGSVLPVRAAELQQRSEFVAPIMIVNTSFLNIRTGPGAEYTVLITVVGGTELPVLSVAEDGVWYQVSTLAGVGWINSEFGVARGDFSRVPVLTLREILAQAVPVTGVNEPSDDTAGSTGFVAGREWGVSIVESHPARTRAGIGSDSPGTATANLSVIYNIAEAVTADGIVWYRISDNFLGSVWVEGPKTLFRPFACTDDFTVVVFNKGVLPTVGPDGSGTLSGNLGVDAGREAYLLDARNQQYKIELFDGNTGWVAATDADVRDEDAISKPFCVNRPTTPIVTDPDGGGNVVGGPQLVGARAVINTAFLNARSGPGAQYTVVTTLSGGTEVPIIGIAPDGVWYLIEGSFGEAWINSEFTLFRGDGRSLPIVRDFSGSIISRPTATVTNAVTLYAAPNTTLGVIGALSGVLEEVTIVARTENSDWLQLQTALGFGWVRASEVTIVGDISVIPVVGG